LPINFIDYFVEFIFYFYLFELMSSNKKCKLQGKRKNPNVFLFYNNYFVANAKVSIVNSADANTYVIGHELIRCHAHRIHCCMAEYTNNVNYLLAGR